MRADPVPDRAEIGDDVRHAERGRPGPGAEGGRGAPLFIAGPDRSGTTLMYALLASHADVSMVRRTNMWRYFHGRYGDLAEPANRERCLAAMVGYRRMRHLQPDPDRIRREFLQGAPTYGRLFALFHQHHAERAGARRWGDKSLHTEHYADRVFAEFPDARIIHMIRDPRDRYASACNRHGQELSRVGAATGRWLASTRAARRNQARHSDRYVVVRYEDLARAPDRTMRQICADVGLAYSPSLLAMSGAPEHRDRGGNSSFGDLEPGAISTRAVGRFRTVLTPPDIAFIQLVARRQMDAFGYQRVDAQLHGPGRLRFWLATLPVGLARMVGWMGLAWARRRRGVPVPPAQRGRAPDDR
jgi:Sulfotransferase family